MNLLHFHEICKVRALRAGQLKVESCLSMPVHVVVIAPCFQPQDASKGPYLPRRFQLLLASAYEFLADSFFAEEFRVDGCFFPEIELMEMGHRKFMEMPWIFPSIVVHSWALNVQL